MVLPGYRRDDDALALADAAECEAITRTHARTFALASAFLPAAKQRGAFAVYAFCRLADDIVDRHDGKCPVALKAELDAYRAGVAAALDGRPDGPVFRELLRAVRTYGVPAAVLEELLEGVARDVQPERYRTWEELEKYCQGVAASMESMCTYIFGVAGDESQRERALTYARTLGVAMQLTNILRDVGEDASLGRCYIPDEVLAQFGFTAERVLQDRSIKDDPQWTALMKQEIARARALYRAAAPGIAMLEPDAQRCARACADGYAAILGAIERNNFDSITRRARVSHLARAGLLWNVWFAGASPMHSR